MKYVTVFEVRIKHEYYSDERCTDFTITASPDTLQLLKNHRSLIRTLPDGLGIITQVMDDGHALLPFIKDQVLTFELRLQNPDYMLITDSADIPASAAPLYSNDSLSGNDVSELTLSSRQSWDTEYFEVEKPEMGEAFVLRGKPLSGISIDDIKLTAEVGGISLLGFSDIDKRITVDTTAADAGQGFTIRYPVAPVLPEGVFAHIDIHINGSLPDVSKPLDQAREFTIRYRAKQATWAYYYLTNLDNADSAYRIVDTPPADESAVLAFNDANRRNLITHPDPLDNLASELAERYPELNRFRFLSDSPVRCRQKPHKHVSLHINGNKLTGVLPNPSYRNFSTGRIMVGDTVQQQDWLYEVVKILTQNGA